MAFTSAPTSSTDPVAGSNDGHGVDAPDLRIFVFALFFIFCGITSLNDIIIPKLKDLLNLDHAGATLVQFAFFPALCAVLAVCGGYRAPGG